MNTQFHCDLLFITFELVLFLARTWWCLGDRIKCQDGTWAGHMQGECTTGCTILSGPTNICWNCPFHSTYYETTQNDFLRSQNRAVPQTGFRYLHFTHSNTQMGQNWFAARALHCRMLGTTSSAPVVLRDRPSNGIPRSAHVQEGNYTRWCWGEEGHAEQGTEPSPIQAQLTALTPI